MQTNQLTFTRFIAATLVVMYHYLGIKSNSFLGELVSQGNLMVSYFFFLSGFIMSWIYLPKYKNNQFKLGEYWFLRFSRIYPLYVVGISLFCFISIYFWSVTIDVKILLANLFFIQSWIPDYEITLNFPSWSLSVEMFLYLCLPPILFIFRHYRGRKVVLWVIIFWALSQLIIYILFTFANTIPPTQLYYNPLLHLNTFLCGATLSYIYSSSSVLVNFSRIRANLMLVLGFGLLILILGTDNYIKPYCHNGLLVPIFTILFIGLLHDKTLVSRIFSNRTCSYFGELSFGVYLLQYPVLLIGRHLHDKYNLYGQSTFVF